MKKILNWKIVDLTPNEIETLTLQEVVWESWKDERDLITLKQEKSDAINKMVDATNPLDAVIKQMNQLALIIEEMILERDIITPTMQKGLEMTNWIKAILNK